MSDMGRREFAALAGGAGLLLAAKVWRARAEQPAMPVIGFLSVRSPGESALAKANISLVVTHSTPGTHAAKQATSTIPIVFAAVADPIQAGLVATLHRPGGNLTGLTFFLEEVSGKCVELIEEALPATHLARRSLSIPPTLECSHRLRACSAPPTRWEWNLCASR
jgi:hypothetical protein